MATSIIRALNPGEGWLAPEDVYADRENHVVSGDDPTVHHLVIAKGQRLAQRHYDVLIWPNADETETEPPAPRGKQIPAPPATKQITGPEGSK